MHAATLRTLTVRTVAAREGEATIHEKVARRAVVSDHLFKFLGRHVREVRNCDRAAVAQILINQSSLWDYLGNQRTSYRSLICQVAGEHRHRSSGENL